MADGYYHLNWGNNYVNIHAKGKKSDKKLFRQYIYTKSTGLTHDDYIK